MGLTTGPGIGSHYPQLNLVAKPFICPNGQMSHTNQLLERNAVFRYASPLYIVLYFAAFLIITYVYWNSSIGPAQNDGLCLW